MREEASKIVELPEEDEEVFSEILTYLYWRTFDSKSIQLLSKIYGAAEKYQLDSLQRCTLEKVASLPKVSAADWLSFSREVYENLPQSDKIFPHFFVEQSVKHEYLLDDDPDAKQNISQILLSGGPMAVDVGAVYRQHYERVGAKPSICATCGYYRG